MDGAHNEKAVIKYRIDLQHEREERTIKLGNSFIERETTSATTKF